jgi:hypothetical protein
VTLYTNLRSLTMLAASDAKHVSNAGAAGCSEDGGADRQLAAVPEHRQLVYVAPGGGRGQAHAQEACQAACESCCRCDAMSSTSLQSGTSLQRCYTYLISWYNFRASTLRRFFKCNSCDEYDVPIEWERQLNSQVGSDSSAKSRGLPGLGSCCVSMANILSTSRLTATTHQHFHGETNCDLPLLHQIDDFDRGPQDLSCPPGCKPPKDSAEQWLLPW